ncbi:hypothetical protein ASPWEDRAFT_699551 [Aspergillus wentii DTO 134E9]|uniref:Chitin-binding type-4 domain-containing protein n=1 Tax=Aspergillus wentii DTO 134E9 TaxID=1073089 RepID=A0A1L9R567_ASPWE|nr:uncharacterized protein ASPWEDRAFT_699551 [Aspergillus wentii DTO 134E9]KAI9923708.1 hypothetical protein MW887_008335 [Aspergillus wentii]OJJ30059.1 hypothetical protein ASPWEDRAFT_699551 [Aspergillus wentii DTO 134E9]
MLFSKTGFVAAILLGASTVNAHLYMKSPHPYGQSTLNNSPLAADGSDFPCKQRNGVYAAANGDNTFKIGEEQSLTLVGSATHGGGSCQISLSTDLKPTKNSKWMVIKSWEGGCPIKTNGNIGNSPSSTVPSNLKFKIPKGIKNGKYTLAWTWFNRIGNREMYMNCAPITVTGGSSKRSNDEASIQKRSSNFPPMFIANVNGCTTKENYDIRFPNPGKYVQKLGDAKNLLPKGQSACTGTPKFGAAGNKKASTRRRNAGHHFRA